MSCTCTPIDQHSYSFQYNHEYSRDLEIFLDSNPIDNGAIVSSWRQARRNPLALFTQHGSLPIQKAIINTFASHLSSFSGHINVFLYRLDYIELMILIAAKKNMTIHIMIND